MLKKITSFDNTSIVYHIHKASPQYIFFLHGIGKSSAFWDREAEIFQNLGFSTVVPDLRGHGHSDKPENRDAYHLENFAKDIQSIMDVEKIPYAHFIGHSFGGILSIAYYKMCKEKVKSLVVVNIDYKVPRSMDFLLKIKPLLRFFSIFSTRYRDGAEFLTSLQARHCISCLHETVEKDMQQKERMLQNIKIPILYLKSKRDRVIPQKELETAYLLIQSAELVEFERAHHDLIPEHPDEAGRYILSFLTKNHLVTMPHTHAVAIALIAAVVGFLSAPNLLLPLFQGGITGAAVVNPALPSPLAFGKFLFNGLLTFVLLGMFWKVFHISGEKKRTVKPLC